MEALIVLKSDHLMMTTPTNQSKVILPNPTQMDRKRRLRQFNWLYVYTPLLIGLIVFLALLGLLVWLTLFQAREESLLFASGMADMILILLMLPMALIGIIGPLALVSIIVLSYRLRQKRKETAQPGNVVQRYSWRAEGLIDTAISKVNSYSYKTVQLMAKLKGHFNYWATFVKKIYDNFIRR